jgi:Flp pilus assembly protein TadB
MSNPNAPGERRDRRTSRSESTKNGASQADVRTAVQAETGARPHDSELGAQTPAWLVKRGRRVTLAGALALSGFALVVTGHSTAASQLVGVGAAHLVVAALLVAAVAVQARREAA